MSRYLATAVALLGLAALPTMAAAVHKPNHQPGSLELTIGAEPNPVVYGRATVVSGRLSGNNRAGRTVTLDGAQYPYTSFRSAIATTVTDANGNFSFRRRPRLHTIYRARAAGTQAQVTVKVRMRVSLYLSDRTPERGQLVRFSGRACPRNGRALVSIQKRRSDGSWRTVRRTRLRNARRCSVYSRRLRLYRDGSFRVVVNGNASRLRGFSRRRFADVHR